MSRLGQQIERLRELYSGNDFPDKVKSPLDVWNSIDVLYRSKVIEAIAQIYSEHFQDKEISRLLSSEPKVNECISEELQIKILQRLLKIEPTIEALAQNFVEQFKLQQKA